MTPFPVIMSHPRPIDQLSFHSVFTRPPQMLRSLSPSLVRAKPRPLSMSEHLAVQSLCDHLSVHDRDVHEEKQDHKEIVHESQEAEECLGDDVEWRGQVGERSHQAEKNSDPEHPEEAAH